MNPRARSMVPALPLLFVVACGPAVRSQASTEGADDGDACAASAMCAVEPPRGWLGPALLQVSDAAPASCPAPLDLVLVGNAGEALASHSCTQCFCGPAFGAVCSPTTVDIYDNSACEGAPVTTVSPDPATCTVTGGGYGAIASTSAPLGGSCAPAGGGLVKDEPTWSGQAVLCAMPAERDACAGDVCMPDAADFDAATCVYREGRFDCPEAFPRRELVHREVVDDRACSACSCSAPGGGCGLLVGHVNEACDIVLGAHPIPVDGLCHADTYYVALAFADGASTVSCAPSGGEPLGGVSGGGTVTVCCTGDP